MFEKLLTLAATYQQKAMDAEHGINPQRQLSR